MILFVMLHVMPLNTKEHLKISNVFLQVGETRWNCNIATNTTFFKFSSITHSPLKIYLYISWDVLSVLRHWLLMLLIYFNQCGRDYNTKFNTDYTIANDKDSAPSFCLITSIYFIPYDENFIFKNQVILWGV